MSLKLYQSVPMHFTVKTIWEPITLPNGQIGIAFAEKTVPEPYIKDYDDDIDPDVGLEWAQTWDISNWGFFGAYQENGTLVGGATVVYDTNNVNMLEGRKDITVLWDIRVAPAFRGRGVGQQLFKTAVNWSQARNVIGMKIETQNINVPACRFYAKQGCHLISINRIAYPDLPHEIQLNWFYPMPPQQ